jgi:hypothetical protein
MDLSSANNLFWAVKAIYKLNGSVVCGSTSQWNASSFSEDPSLLADPLLGSTPVGKKPLAGSPAINGGTRKLHFSVTKDIVDRSRMKGEVDIGAFEVR